MNKKELKKQYIAHCESTAPDMDKLWERIESGLEEKPENGVSSKPVRSFNLRWAAAAAAVLVLIPSILIGTNNTKGSMSMDGGAALDEAYQMIAEAKSETTAAAAADNFDMAAGETASLPETVCYEELSFNTYAEEIPVPTAKPFGDEFFVEEKVLAETDIIVDAVVSSVYKGEGGTVCYVLTAEDGGIGSVTVESASRYTLKPDREYILPLKKTEDGYRLAFENAPQIERTLDGGLVFHNGWACLAENSAELIYPQAYADDFFYDRMRFSYTDGMASLTEKWRELKESEE